jgi:oxygen-independent coproporphyrinogen III oxidase
VIQQIMCNFVVRKADVKERFGVEFDEYLASSLARLDDVREAGFVVVDDEGLRVTPQGRVFVRNVCMAFDRYLLDKEDARRPGTSPVFSRTV